MKYAVVYNGGNDESKYVGSLSEYKCGEFSANPILMSEEEANELMKDLDNYVRNVEYIGKTDEDNEQAHWAYDKHEWGFQVEEFDIIDSLQELADYINSDDYNQLEVNRIIEANGWTDLSGENDYDVCAHNGQKVTLDQNTGEAIVVDDEVVMDTVHLYLVHTYEAYRADECGKRWSLTEPKDTIDYKHTVLKEQDFVLPEGVHEDDIYSVHTDDDGSPIIETSTDVIKLTTTTVDYERARIGQRIAKLRKQAGMTQAQLADKCGMQQSNIARIENGRYGITIDVLARIAQALGKRIDLV